MAGPPLPCWVAGLAPLVASVPETDALRYPARNLVSPTPLLVVPLPIAGQFVAQRGKNGRRRRNVERWTQKELQKFPVNYYPFYALRGCLHWFLNRSQL
ncbi:hypothetical protein H6P81_021650 [Aristolochia fimbriata]|uniref:Secreted protein n=1 Tax=Aristolochia fimbriata TaxID=158543 RepID=A0AAV7DPC6_ARIFI|nr:hypothetical protein H6P81_021650 [Aristolochia fimbriata]